MKRFGQSQLTCKDLMLYEAYPRPRCTFTWFVSDWKKATVLKKTCLLNSDWVKQGPLLETLSFHYTICNQNQWEISVNNDKTYPILTAFYVDPFCETVLTSFILVNNLDGDKSWPFFSKNIQLKISILEVVYRSPPAFHPTTKLKGRQMKALNIFLLMFRMTVSPSLEPLVHTPYPLKWSV